MIDITHNPEADAGYMRMGSGQFDHTEEAGPFIYDVDSAGRILGIEILFVSKVLAPGPWQRARLPGSSLENPADKLQKNFSHKP